MRTFTKAVASGLMIVLGVTVYLACPNKIVGAFLFSIALFFICAFGMNLFTGKIGYVIQKRNDPNCLVIWLGNLAGCVVGAGLIRLAKPQLAEASAKLMDAKLENGWLSIAVSALFCGFLMYLAVENYASNPSAVGKIVGIFLCIPTFIISGFEHSIADMGYAVLAAADIGGAGRMLLFVAVVSLFNGLGSVALHSLNMYNKARD